MNGHELKNRMMGGAGPMPSAEAPSPVGAQDILNLLLGIRSQYTSDTSEKGKAIKAEIDTRVLTIIQGFHIQKASNA